MLGRFFASIYKEDNFLDFHFGFKDTKPLLKKESTLKGTELPPVGTLFKDKADKTMNQFIPSNP